MAPGTAGGLAHCRWIADHRHPSRFLLDEREQRAEHAPAQGPRFTQGRLHHRSPHGQFAQRAHAGLLVYFDPFTFVAFNKEFTGKQCIFVFHQQDGKPIQGPGETDYKESGVWLRLTLRGTKATAQYRSSEKEPWKPIGECPIPTSTKELLVGFQSGYGQEKSERQARFRSFRILPWSE